MKTSKSELLNVLKALYKLEDLVIDEIAKIEKVKSSGFNESEKINEYKKEIEKYSKIIHTRKDQSEYYRNWYLKNGRKRKVSDINKIQEWWESNPEKVKASSIFRQFMKKNNIPKPKECSLCNKQRYVVAHHSDYSKPLEITWVCSSCHKKLHYKK